MASITITNLTFAHAGGPTLFENVSLDLDTGWKLALIGRNGRGKTTFCHLLLGRYPFTGSIRTPLALDYFPYAVPDPTRSARSIARGICPDTEDWQVDRELALLEVQPHVLERPFNTLSGGEATKILLAILFLRKSVFPLIDEPTNHLDAHARQVVGAYLKTKPGFILVSHDRSLLDSCVDHFLAITREDMSLQRGNFSTWQRNQEQQDERERADNARLKKEIRRLEASARQSADWSFAAERGKYGNGPVDRGFIGHKAAKMMRRAKNTQARRDRAVEEKSGLLRNLETDSPLTMRNLLYHGSRLVDCEHLWYEYGMTPVLSDISFRLLNGERMVLAGRNGSGKSTLLKLLAGQLTGKKGRLYLPPTLRVSYVPQDTSFLSGSLKDFARNRNIEESLLRAVLCRLGCERSHLAVDTASYSAGQKKKVLLAASLCEEAHLYIWDEPLNHIDVISRVQIENLIAEHQPSMVLVEHDRVFVERVATIRMDLDEPVFGQPVMNPRG